MESNRAEQDLTLNQPDAETARAIHIFVRLLPKTYSIRDLILFGSRARSSHRPESDADLAIVLAGHPGDRFDAVRDMAGIAFDVMLETGVLIQAVPLWVDEIDHPERSANPALIHNIFREGVRV